MSSASGNVFFDVVMQTDQLISSQLSDLGPVTLVLVLASGLLTSFSPCTLSVLPLTVGYIGGFKEEGEQNDSSSLPIRALSFSAGLATTFTVLGLASVSLGKAYGQTGTLLPVVVSVVAIVMGLSLLEVLVVPLPSLNLEVGDLQVSSSFKAYLAGLTFALIASPCSTPILATLLAYVSTSQDYVEGGLLLFSYALGYVAPLMAVAFFTDSLKSVLSMRQFTSWVTPVSGVLLVAGGTYGVLSRVFE